MSIKWNGTDLTKVRHDEPAGNVRTEIWYLLNPAAGSFNLVADYTGSLGEATLGAISLIGAVQAAPEANNGTTGTNDSPSVLLTTVANNAWSVTVACAEAAFTAVNNSQTALTGYPLTDQSFENAHAARREITPAGATTLGYTIASAQIWAISAVSVAPFCGSASVSPSVSPSISPSASVSPSISPSVSPSVSPSQSPSASVSPSVSPSISPSISPSRSPSVSPSVSPSISPSVSPSISPSISPSASPSAPPEPEARLLTLQGVGQ